MAFSAPTIPFYSSHCHKIFGGLLRRGDQIDERKWKYYKEGALDASQAIFILLHTLGTSTSHIRSFLSLSSTDFGHALPTVIEWLGTDVYWILDAMSLDTMAGILAQATRGNVEHRM